MYMFRNEANFDGEGLLAHRPNPKLKDHPLWCDRNLFFYVFHQQPDDVPSLMI
jgi:nuclear transport factor 2 (NTF2) superfamily protein